MHGISIDYQSLFNIFSFVALITSATIVVFSQIRTNDLKVLRASNKDLRDSIDDKSTQINELEVKMNILEKKVAVLEAKNNDLSILVKEALVMYFTRNPKMAEKVQAENN